MEYVPPLNGDMGDPDRPYIDANPAHGIEGSIPSANAIEHPMREIVAVIKSAGIAPDEADLTQLYQGIVNIVEEHIAEIPKSLPTPIPNKRGVIVFSADTATGTVVTLPISYYPTTKTLHVYYNNMLCIDKSTNAASFQYEEVGTDSAVASNQIKIHFGVKTDDVLDSIVIQAIVVGGAVAAESAEASASNALASANLASTSQIAAKFSEDVAKVSANQAQASANEALASKDEAHTAKTAAETSEIHAASSESNAEASEETTAISVSNANASVEAAGVAKTQAQTAASNALASANASAASATAAQTAKSGAETAADKSEASASASDASAIASEVSQIAAKASQGTAAASAVTASSYVATVEASANAAAISASNANASAETAETARTQAQTFASNASGSASNAATSVTAAEDILDQFPNPATGTEGQITRVRVVNTVPTLKFENFPVIPAKVSQLTNDSGFVTNTVQNLVNYYAKSTTYNKTEVDALISAIVTLDIKVVAVLPTENISTTTIYLVPIAGSSPNIYEEYVHVNSNWELIGSTQIDLTSYAQKTWVTAQIADFLTSDEIATLLTTKADNTALSAEITARTNADTALTNSIATKANTSALSAEATARTNADTALGVRIDDIIAGSIDIDTTIPATPLNTRVPSIKLMADQLVLKATISALSTERIARTNADIALGTRIDGKANTSALSAETAARTSTDTALGTRIDSKADITALNTKANTSALSTEITARTNADTALTSSIASKANTSALSAEATARTNADRALGTRIDGIIATASTITRTVRAITPALPANSVLTVPSYVVNKNRLQVYYNGYLTRAGTSATGFYSERNTTSITIHHALPVNSELEYIVFTN